MGPKSQRKTPSNAKENDSLDISSFSPKSVGSPSQNLSGTLTGSARKLKDGAADLHNYILKWRVLNTEGADIVNEIANIKLEKILSKNEETPESEMLPDSLLPLCEKLETVLERMEKVVARLNTVVEMSRGVAALEKFNKPESSSIILFQTWDVGRFAEVFTEITDKYSQEMKLKHNVAENICHATDRNTVMFYSACWLHQVYVNNGDDILLESVLLETCHKT